MSKPSEQTKSALGYSMGLALAFNVIGGIVVGYLVDRWFQTRPWALLAGILLGVFGGLAGIYRITKQLNQE
ncbi:MAG: AtpZ/AtpI family protein [Acidobacteriota bacterium]